MLRESSDAAVESAEPLAEAHVLQPALSLCRSAVESGERLDEGFNKQANSRGDLLP